MSDNKLVEQVRQQAISDCIDRVKEFHHDVAAVNVSIPTSEGQSAEAAYNRVIEELEKMKEVR
jgi:hypothetical protein